MSGGSLTDGVLLRVEVVGGVHPVELGVLLGDQLIDALTFAAFGPLVFNPVVAPDNPERDQDVDPHGEGDGIETVTHDSVSLVEEVVAGGGGAEVGLSGFASCAEGFAVAELLDVA